MTKKKKIKKPSISTLRRKADKLWSAKVKEINGYKCAITGTDESREMLNSHHIEDKTNLALRWDVINGICLSVGTHKFRKDSAHKSTVWFYEWLLENRPKVIEYVKAHRNDNIKNTVEHMQEVIGKLSQPPTDEEKSVIFG
jgi:hypothetical protein